MNTNSNELNLSEMEMVNGGVDLDLPRLAGPAAAGGIFGGFTGGAIAAGLGLAAGPAGLLVLGTVAVGGAAFATIKSLTSK